MARPKQPKLYLNITQVEEYLGVARGALSKIKLPTPDVIVGPAEDASGKLPRGSSRGWLPATIDEWNANRPGRGARTDLGER